MIEALRPNQMSSPIPSVAAHPSVVDVLVNTLGIMLVYFLVYFM